MAQKEKGEQGPYLLAIPAGVGQPQSVAVWMGNTSALPDHLIKPTLAAVKGIGPVVGRQLVGPPLQGEDPLGYPVRHSAHHSPKIGAATVLEKDNIGFNHLGTHWLLWTGPRGID